MPKSTTYSLFVFAALLVVTCSTFGAEAASTDGVAREFPLTPKSAFSLIQQQDSEDTPVIVAQGELDNLIDTGGGGACPISAALIGYQGLRSMAGLPLHPHPHRLALHIFREKPELKEGLISNQRFVDLITFICQNMERGPVAITTESAPNSQYNESGPQWPEDNGPDLTTSNGELKVLAYTVSKADGTVLGRHFVLLTQSDGRQIEFINPGRPEKQYKFIVEYRGDSFDSRKQVFFLNPAGIGGSSNTHELNTIFTIRLAEDDLPQGHPESASVDLIKTKIDQLAAQLRASDEFLSPRAWRRHGASFGLPGLDLPTQLGGSGYSASDAVEVFRHAGRHNLNLRDVIGGAHGRPLVKSDSPLAKKVIADTISGDAYVAVAITEPDAGSDMRQMQSKAIRDGDGFKLTGSKLWNARLRQATHVVIYTQSANGEPGKRTAFLVPIDHPGLEIVDRYAHGLAGNSFGGLTFEDMHVGPENLIGEDGDGGRIFDEHFLYWRLMQAAAAIGCGEQALDQMADRIRERHVYGGPIGRFTHLQQPIGEYLTKLRMAMALAREAAQLIDDGDYEAASPLVNGLKAEGVEIALAACDAAMRAHGALGYSRDVDLGDRVRDLMGLRIADGTTDVMRMMVVRGMYGYDFWKMSIRSYQDNSPQLGEATKTDAKATAGPHNPDES